MLEGFGLAPVCLELDLDSYEGDWRHVSRFRGRSGWLTVAEAQLQVGGREWITTLVAACDEWGTPVPNFMAPNLLACACSLPQPCSDFPPPELEQILQMERGELKHRWLRENNQILKALDTEIAEEIGRLEAEAKQRLARRDAAIADLRRRRRFAGASHEQRTLLTELIQELEDEQDQIAERLAAERFRLRGRLVAREREILNRTNIHVEVEPLFYVNWQGSSSVRGRSDEVESLMRWMRYSSSFFPFTPAKRMDDEVDAFFSARFQLQTLVEPASRAFVQPEPGALSAEEPVQGIEPASEPTPAPTAPVPKPAPAARTPKKSHVALPGCNHRSAAPAGTRPPGNSRHVHRAAADLWLQSKRLVSKLDRSTTLDGPKLKKLAEKHADLTRWSDRLHAQLNGASPVPLTEARQNLQEAAALFEVRGLGLDGDL